MKLPPSIAAFLVVAFILWLFRRYSKQSAGLSFGSWVPLLWVGVISSKPIGYWFASGTAAADATDLSEGSFIDRNVYLFLIILGVVILARRRVDWRTILSQNRWLWLFYFYLLLSTVWSDFTFISFKRWFKEVGSIVMILIIATEKDPIEAMRSVFVRSAYVLIPVSVLFIKWYPDLGRYYDRWSWEVNYCGVTTNKNSLGVLGMVSGLFLLWSAVDVHKYRRIGDRIRSEWPDLVVLAMCLWLLSIAHSATALSCFVIGAAINLAARLGWVRSNLRRLSWVGLGVALLMLAFTAMPDFRQAIAGALGRDVTLTGRTDIWKAVLEAGTSPGIGVGFASFWLTPKGRELSDALNIPHAHNGYLETYLHSGWIGVFLLIAALLSAGRQVSRQLAADTVPGRLFMGLFLSGLLHNYTEVSFNNLNVVGLCMWLIAAWNGRSVKIRLANEVNAGTILAKRMLEMKS